MPFVGILLLIRAIALAPFLFCYKIYKLCAAQKSNGGGGGGGGLTSKPERRNAAAVELLSATDGEDIPRLEKAIKKALDFEIDTTAASARLVRLVEAAVRKWV